MHQTIWEELRIKLWKKKKSGNAIFLSKFRLKIQPSSSSRIFAACIDGYDRTWLPNLDYATGTQTPLKGQGTLLNRIALSNSITNKCKSMQAVKQPVQEKASNTMEWNYFSFQKSCDSCNSVGFASEDRLSSKCHLIKKDRKDLKWKGGSFLPLRLPWKILLCCLHECGNQRDKRSVHT